MKKWIRITLVILVLLILLPTAGFVVWAETPLGPAAEAQAALVSDDSVKVTQDRWIVFQPTGSDPTTGFIFYPGARVDERSYAPQLRAIAAQGYLAVIVPMPLNLAIFKPSAADDVIAAFPQIKHWAIGGHSMGGAMSVTYTHDHVDKVQGVALWAAYPQESDSLAAQATLPATAIFGLNDGLVDASEREKAKTYMPPDTLQTLIEGGNHAQFGAYGPQPGDNPATITPDEQQRETVAATVALLERVRQQ